MLIALAVTLLFLISPNYTYSRLTLEVWELGHFFLFFSLSSFWLYFFILKKRRTLSVYLYLFICFALAVLTEAIQQMLPYRTFSLSDMAKNMIGSSYALILYLMFKQKINKYYFGLITILLSVLLFYRLTALLIEQWQMQSRLPMLSDFEDSSELSMWGYSNVFITDTIAAKGQHSLKVKVHNSNLYSGAGLNYFPNDWSDYQSLQLSIYTKKATQLTIRINDRIHINNNAYDDRFNRELKLTKGWNLISIPLVDVESAPSRRMMNMKEIHSLGIFSTQPHNITEFYIDNVFLK